MRLRHGVLLALALAALMAAGCDAAADNDPTPVTHFKITPASGSPAASTPALTPTVAATAGSGGAEISIGAKNSNLKFDKESLTASAGAVTIVFNNADSGIAHNIHVFEGKDAKGKSLGQTDLESGPIDQKLKLDLSAGTYYFQCDAHPTTMKGTLTVS